MSTRNQRKYALNSQGAIERVDRLEFAVQQVRELASNLRASNSGREFVHADTVADNILAVLDNLT